MGILIAAAAVVIIIVVSFSGTFQTMNVVLLGNALNIIDRESKPIFGSFISKIIENSYAPCKHKIPRIQLKRPTEFIFDATIQITIIHYCSKLLVLQRKRWIDVDCSVVPAILSVQCLNKVVPKELQNTGIVIRIGQYCLQMRIPINFKPQIFQRS